MLITFLTFIRHLTGSFQGFSFWCFHNVIFIQNSWWKRYLIVGINFISNHILDSLQNTTKTDYFLSILNDMYWKNFKTLCVKFIDKIGHTLVVDLAYIIMHHLNQFVEPCHCKIKNFQNALILPNTLLKISKYFHFAFDQGKRNHKEEL